jgi:hypothetical protein
MQKYLNEKKRLLKEGRLSKYPKGELSFDFFYKN